MIKLNLKKIVSAMNKNSDYSIAEILAARAKVGSKVTVRGWVKTRRDSKAGFSFLVINDGSCLQSLQVVAPISLANYEADVLRLTAGCSVAIVGKLVASPAKGQKFEVQASEVKVYGFVADPDTYPMAPKKHSLEHLRENAHLRPRTNLFGAMTRVQHCVSLALHRFFHENGFYWIHTPIITASDCEGAGALFRVSTLDLLNLPFDDKGAVNFANDYFGKEAFLTVSGQLNVESFCCAMSKVYTFGPTFRAENFNTSRHLSEFWMIEPEIAFADLGDSIKLAEAMLKYIAKAVLEECAADMDYFVKEVDKECVKRLKHIISNDVVPMDYSEAITHLEKTKERFEYPVRWGLDLQSEHERYLTEKLIGKPVALMNYPKETKAFYMRQNDDDKTVAAVDILVPGMGEIIGGSQREERLEMLEKRMQEMNIAKDSMPWYLDLRRYGTVPHAGYGVGFERLIGYITGVGNIRDVIPFPRAPKYIEF